MQPRFRASSETRLNALRVRLMLMSYQDSQHTADLLHRIESLGVRIGSRGLVRVARQLWESVESTTRPSASA